MRILKYIVVSVVLAVCVSVISFAQADVTVTLNGNIVDCASYGQEATIVEGRTLVPLRAIFEELGAVVEWNPNTKTVTSTMADVKVKLTIGEKVLYRNGEEIELDVPALIMNGRTLVPVRAVSEAYDVVVEWDRETRTVILSKNGYLRGKVRENVYISKWLNMKFTCPDGFSYADEEYLRDILETTADVNLENIDIASVMSMYEFVVFNDTSLSLNVSQNTSAMTKKAYVKDMFDAYRAWNLDFDASDFYTTEIAGMEFESYESVVALGEANIGVVVHVAEKDGYFVTLSGLYYDRAEYEKLMSCFEPLAETQKTEEKLLTFDEMLVEIGKHAKKSKYDEEKLVKFDDVSVSASVVRYASALALMSDLSDKDFEVAVKDYVKSIIAVECAVREQNVTFTEDELSEFIIKAEYIDAYFGENSDALYANAGFSSAYDYCYQTMLMGALTKIVESKSDDDRFMKKVYDRTFSALEKGEYVRAKHILVQADKSNREEKLSEINRILSLVNKNPDKFDLYVKTFGEDPGMESYPGGYVFTKGEMVESFEKVAYGTGEGNVSGVVETDYGFHIIMRLPITREDFDTTSGYESELFRTAIKQTLVETIVDGSDDFIVAYSSDFLKKAEQYTLEFVEAMMMYS